MENLIRVLQEVRHWHADGHRYRVQQLNQLVAFAHELGDERASQGLRELARECLRQLENPHRKKTSFADDDEEEG